MARHRSYNIIREGGPSFGQFIKANTCGIVQITTRDSHFALGLLLGDDRDKALAKGKIRFGYMARMEKRRGRSIHVWRVVEIKKKHIEDLRVMSQ
jgi:hypothetical protein